MFKNYIKRKINEFMLAPPIVFSEHINKRKIKSIISDEYEITYIVHEPQKITNENKIIVWSHSNSTDCYTMYSYCKELANLLGIHIVMYDYRGFGLSKGKSNDCTMCQDLHVIITEMKKKFKEIYLIGHSIGTGVVVEYVDKYEWEMPIMLISPYKSILSVFFNNNQDLAQYFDNIDIFKTYLKITNIECPVKIIHGENDKLINISQAKYLYEKLKNKKLDPCWIKETGHNDILFNIDENEFKIFLNLKIL